MSAHSGGKRTKAAPRNKIWVAILTLLTVLLLWSALRAEAVPAGQGIVPQTAYLNTSGPLYHYTDPTGDVIAGPGVDVSSYQGDIDWNAVREAGAEFAIVRVGFRGYGTGAIVEDSRFLQNVQGAKAAGLEVGVYFYSQALTEAEAEEEALFTLERVQALGLTGPVAYDLEFYTADEARTDALTGQQATLNAAAFCQVLETAGLRSVVYMNGPLVRGHVRFGCAGGLAHLVRRVRPAAHAGTGCAAVAVHRGRHAPRHYRTGGHGPLVREAGHLSIIIGIKGRLPEWEPPFLSD